MGAKYQAESKLTSSVAGSANKRLEESFERTLAQRSGNLSSRYRPLSGFSVVHLRAEVSSERFDPQVNPAKHSILVASNIADSEVRIDSRSKRSIFQPGDVHLVPRGSITNGHCNTPSEFVHLLLDEQCLEKVRDEVDGPIRLELMPVLQSRDELLRHLAHTLVAELAQNAAFDVLYVETLTRAIVAHIIKTFGVAPSERDKGYRLPLNVIGTVVDYVAENLADDISLEALSIVTGVSPSKLHRHFKKATGEPLHQYVIRQRVKRARELLAGTELPMAEIAHATGFSDQSHLTRVVRQHTGLTPRAFRSL